MMCPHRYFIPQWNVQPHTALPAHRNLRVISAAFREPREQLPKSPSTFSRLEQVAQPGYYITVAAEAAFPDISVPYETRSPQKRLHCALILVRSAWNRINLRVLFAVTTHRNNCKNHLFLDWGSILAQLEPTVPVQTSEGRAAQQWQCPVSMCSWEGLEKWHFWLDRSQAELQRQHGHS